MYKEEIIQQNSPGTVREAFESVDKGQWKRVSFIDSYDQGCSFDIGDEEAIGRFLDLNGGFRAVFEPHASWSPDTVQIDCEMIAG